MILPGERAVVEDWIVDDWPHTCTIMRREVIGEDPHRNPTMGPYTDYLTGVPCFYWWRSGVERHEDNRTFIEYQNRILLPRDTDVTEDDVIADIREKDGTPVTSVRMDIDAIGPRSTNLSLVLREVR